MTDMHIRAANWINAQRMLVPMMPTQKMLDAAYRRINDRARDQFGDEAVRDALPIVAEYEANRQARI